MRWCTSKICKTKRIRLFALIINSTIIMKANSRFSQNVYTISDRIWCNKYLRHTTTEKYDNNGKGGYFRFDDDNFHVDIWVAISLTEYEWPYQIIVELHGKYWIRGYLMALLLVHFCSIFLWMICPFSLKVAIYIIMLMITLMKFIPDLKAVKLNLKHERSSCSQNNDVMKGTPNKFHIMVMSS